MFLTEEDYLQAIRNDHLTQITEDQPARLTRAEASAIDEISSYLNAAEIYDTAKVFNPDTDNPRNEYIVTVCVDVMLYHLHKGIVPRNIPEVRITAYDNAIKWLQGVADGTNKPTLPKLPTGTVETSFSFIYNHPKQDWYF